MRLADMLYAEQGEKHLPRTVAGFKIIVEYPKGSIRELKNDEGKTVYRKYMHYSYGYFDNTKGRDGDEVDAIIGPAFKFDEVFIVHMKDLGPDKDEREDEDKIMLGFQSADAAKRAFLTMYPDTFYDGMTSLPLSAFKKKLDTASLPFHKRKITATISISARATGLVTEQFTISTKPDVMERLKRFLRHVEWCAGVGHSCTVAMDIDGDGPDAFYVDKPALKKIKSKIEEYGARRVEIAHTAINAKARKCPECGNTEFALMPTDFETAKCTACGKIMDSAAEIEEVTAGGPGSGRHPYGTQAVETALNKLDALKEEDGMVDASSILGVGVPDYGGYEVEDLPSRQEVVPIRNIRVTDEVNAVYKGKVKDYIEHPADTRVTLTRDRKGLLYIEDGNHRVVAAALLGKTVIKANVVTIPKSSVTAYSEDEERDSSGKWTKGGDSETKSKPLDKSALAKLNYKPSTKAKQAAADKSEEVVSKALGLPRTKNNSAFDLQSPKVGVEIKTLIDNKNDKVTMHPESRRRKEAEAAAKGLRMYTVVVDKRGRSAGYYYAKGIGAFRISHMARVDNLAGLRMAIR